MGELPEDAGFTPPLFSDEHTHAMANFIEAHGKARARAQGSDFSETDYLAGAMAVFFALRLQNRMPASWIFSTLAGRSPLGVEVPDRTVYVVLAGQLRQPVAVYENRAQAVEHVEQLWREDDEHAYVATENVRREVDGEIAKRADAWYENEMIRREERMYGDR